MLDIHFPRASSVILYSSIDLGTIDGNTLAMAPFIHIIYLDPFVVGVHHTYTPAHAHTHTQFKFEWSMAVRTIHIHLVIRDLLYTARRVNIK